MSHLQHTLKNAIHARGVGLHSGRMVTITVRPAAEEHGIRFLRTDLAAPVEIPASLDAVVSTEFATTLASGSARLGTVEHLLSALAGVGIDNALVEVDADELPIMDGSAAPFIFLLESAGITAQQAPRRYLRVTETVAHLDGEATAMLSPYGGLLLEYTLDYDHPVLSKHSNRVAVEFSQTAYRRELSRARTFGLLADLEQLRARDLARGGSLDNALVVSDAKILNDSGLRLTDEFARHKILDAVGDCYLLGHPLLGRFTGYKSGHSLNIALLQRLRARPDSFELVTYAAADAVPGGYATADEAGMLAAAG
ncbi:MAG: UDP-3-O-acyl-N-acetylglucosamine deacetylase [Pseudomonadota bacterium]